ncbi:MAG: preprotein translocase subunit YajC [Clostridia bacterium]|nr:preprotein translocase subunit YajC [Clostridia bacterium]
MFTPFLLTSGADTAANTGGSLTMIVMIVVMLAVMYFFMIRPQKKQERETNAMRNSLKVGDEITTIGGVIGAIVSIHEESQTLVIETTQNRTKIRIHKWAVRQVDVHAEDAQK